MPRGLTCTTWWCCRLPDCRAPGLPRRPWDIGTPLAAQSPAGRHPHPPNGMRRCRGTTVKLTIWAGTQIIHSACTAGRRDRQTGRQSGSRPSPGMRCCALPHTLHLLLLLLLLLRLAEACSCA